MSNKPQNLSSPSFSSPGCRPVSGALGYRMRFGRGGRNFAPVLATLVALAAAAVGFSSDAAAAKTQPAGSQPVITSTCKKSYVRKFIIEAAKRAKAAAKHLAEVAAGLKRIRAREWNADVENTWFGKYSAARANTAVKWLQKVVATLSSPSLKVSCTKKVKKWEVTRYKRKELLLAKRWIEHSSKSRFKIQNIIRGAAHVAGALRGGHEDKIKRQTTGDLDLGGMSWAMSFGWSRAQKYPAFAVRTANNLGFYAVCFDQRGPCGEWGW